MPSQPPVISQLSEAVANQIAAGEVVERPAAVVKELAENSIDAGATRITVRSDDGGRRLVEIEDDGHGMRGPDLRLALGRHATSKLRDAEDLFRIASLGFRGEALPSIAAVSEFSLASRPHDQEQGWCLTLAGGTETAFAPCAMAPGTRVAVRNLFWNVPARLKFLKAEAAETGHLTEQVMRLALGHPRIAFRLETNGRTVLDLPGQDALELRVRSLFGKQLAASLLPVAATADRMQVTGFVAHPREAKATAKRQYLFLNGRHVRDKLLVAAVREGFRGFLEPRLHGAVFLHLDLDPGLVDVNVHPTKAEVRFRREGEVFTLISRALRKVLELNSGGFSLLAPDAAPPSGTQPIAPIVRREVVRAAPDAAPAWQERFLPSLPDAEAEAAPAPQPVGGAPQRLAEHAAPYAAATRPLAAEAPSPGPAAAHLPGVRRVLQVNRMYLLIETDSGIRLVDQHALHEKALFLCLDPAVTDFSLGGVQELLVPKAIELGAAEVATLAPLLPRLAESGIAAEVFGPTTLLVRATPARLARVNWHTFFADLAAGGSGDAALDGLRRRIAHSAACHGAIKAGQELSQAEMLDLVGLLYRLEHMEHCPHGRPTTLDLGWGELERRFQR